MTPIFAVESFIDSEVSGVYSWGLNCSIAPHSPAKKKGGKIQSTLYTVVNAMMGA